MIRNYQSNIPDDANTGYYIPSDILAKMKEIVRKQGEKNGKREN